MVVRPLVQGAGAARSSVAAGTHTLGMLAGAALTATLLRVLAWSGGPLPAGAVAAVCLAAAVLVAAQARLALPLPGSRWMVPREWARLGTGAYAACFGFALGTGVATLLPSAALYGVLAVAEAATRWWQTYALMLAFAAARGVMVPVLTARSIRRPARMAEGLDRLRDRMGRLAPLEAVLLAALALELLLG